MSVIRNLTPHALVLLTEDSAGEVAGSVGFGRAARETSFRIVAELASEGVARATTSVEEVGTVEVDGELLPVTKTVYGGTADLPAPANGMRLVVSLITANADAAEGRPTDDLLVIGEAVRDAGGRIIGTTGFGAV